MLFIYLFGQPHLLFDSQALKLNAPPKTVPLLVYLLLHRTQTLERQQVAFTLWPDDPETTARANLRRHLHWLGRVLPPYKKQPWLLATPSSLQWNPESEFWLDVAEFEKLAACPETMADAVTLYQGDLCETFYDDWIFFERERLQTTYLTTLTQLIEQCRAQCYHMEACAYARQFLMHEPFREDIVRQLIMLHYEAGDRAGAIAEYNHFARYLHQEMNIAPMPETQALYEIVLCQGRLPGGRDANTTPDAHVHPQTLLPFVGRQQEMDRLIARWHRAAQGHGGLLLVSGEAGMGKTRLVHELTFLTQSQGARVLSGGSTLHEPHSYQAVIMAFQSALPLLASLEGNLDQLAVLAPLLPDLYTRRVLPTPPPIDPNRERVRLFAAISGCLEKLCEPRPLLLVLEDLHWAGESTLALVEFLARQMAQQPVLIVGTYREGETPRSHPLRKACRRLQAEGVADVQPLRRLEITAVSTLLAQLPTPIPELAHPLYTASEGNPFYLSLLLQHWQETGGIAKLTAETVLPDNIRAAIEQRLGTLSPQARAYADVAAIFGTAFDPDVICEVGGWSESQALDALGELLDHRLACDAAHCREYSFTHHLLQSTLYAAIPAVKRKNRHRRTAEVLESLYPDHPQEFAGTLAYHYDRGGVAERAISHYLAAARYRLVVYADAEALAAVERALELADAAAQTTPRLIFDLLELCERIHRRRGEREPQLVKLTQMAQMLSVLNDPELSCEVRRRQILYDNSINNRTDHKAHVECFQREALALGSLYWQAEAAFAVGNYRKRVDDYAAAIIWFQDALALYQQIQHIEGQVRCCCLLAEVFTINRQCAEAEVWTQKALQICPADHPPHQIMNLLWSVAANGLITKDLAHCLNYAVKLRTIAEQTGDRFWQASAHRLLGMTYQRQFLVAQTRQHLNTALALYRSIQQDKGLAFTWETFGHLEVSLGNFTAASYHYQQAFDIQERLGDLNGMASESINLACTASFQEDYIAEGMYARQGLTYARQIQNRHLEGVALQNLGESEREVGDLHMAYKYLTEALAFMADPALFDMRASVLNDLALVQWKAGEISCALQTISEVLLLYPQVQGTDDNVHRFLWTAARVFRANGQLERAQQLLTQAYTTFQDNLLAIPDAESRQAFAQIIHNNQITAAYERDEWPRDL